ncbi:tRNA pseudouridine synthase D [Zopfia rhizophila CBS 207.26]|uniref:tRNA pseudouridine synthase D n=1 Tax=Zopfia rhizophila CBS 207.26 TaxID=1314779 RepID=A0A6A6ESF5_9PEZI|nr:tRNA pseudouridine synthase D [Zopfia rhizophila CBS 207.26]
MADVVALEEPPPKRAKVESPPSTANVASTFTKPSKDQAPNKSKAPTQPVTSNTDRDLEKEIKVGITEYVCPENSGFTGILKQRYTDFLVNEILPSGRVLHLKNLGDNGKTEKGNVEQKLSVSKQASNVEQNGAAVEEPPTSITQVDIESKTEQNGSKVQEKPSSARQDEAAEAEEEVKNDQDDDAAPQVSDEDLETLHSLFGEKTSSDIIGLVKAINKHPGRKARDFKPVISAPITDKDERTNAHVSLRRIFPDKIESVTEQDQCIRIRALPPRDSGRKRKRDYDDDRRGGQRGYGKLSWEELGGEYLHFTLYKENKDTMEVVGYLGSQTKVGARGFQFAGTKDRRGVTVQRVSVKRQTAQRMAHIGRTLRQSYIGDFEHHHQGLELGDLAGNEFLITLRNCHFENEGGLDSTQRVQLAKDVVSKAVKDFSEKGFINYYGLQRFGSFATSTDTVGVKLLQNNLRGAIADILLYTDTALAAANSTDIDTAILVSQDDKARAKALDIWETTKNGREALRILPRKFSAEHNIIQHLSKKGRGKDWQGALYQIPRNLRLMYVHAYQSLVWNVVAGKRWTRFGNKVVEGDLVLVHEHEAKENGISKGKADDVDQDGDVVINPADEDSAFREKDGFERARALSKEEAESGKYCVFDIVLPLPGFDVEYPPNEIGEFYKELMKSERGGGLDPHDMRRSWKELSLSGGYRKLLARPLKELSFEVKEYTNDHEQFVETDIDKLMKKKPKGQKEGGEPEVEAEKGSNGDVEMKEGDREAEIQKKLAIILKLQLGTSQYATMALRELMKAGGVKIYQPEFIGGR